MKVCAVVIMIIIIMGAAKIWDKRTFIFLAAAAGLCFAGAAVQEMGNTEKEITEIEKNEVGSGYSQRELTAVVEGEEIDISVSVPERIYTEKEAKEILEEEERLLPERILGKNESLQRVEYDLELTDRGINKEVTIEWISLEPEILNWEGRIGDIEDEEGREITLKAVLRLQDEERVTEQKIRVYPRAFGGEIKEELLEELRKSNSEAEDEEYHLPGKVGDKDIIWYEAKGRQYVYICGLVLLVGVFLNLSARQKEEEQKKKRLEGLRRNYSELVSRLLMMIYAGSSMRRAFFRIGADYAKRKEADPKTRINEAFEEVIILCHELENGVTESKAYENLSNRCQLPCYRTLSVILIQNQKRGSSMVGTTLEQEVINAFGEKKRQARIAGDAASLKLMLPLGLMLVIAFALMLIPAFLSL